MSDINQLVLENLKKDKKEEDKNKLRLSIILTGGALGMGARLLKNAHKANQAREEHR